MLFVAVELVFFAVVHFVACFIPNNFPFIIIKRAPRLRLSVPGR